MKRIINVTCYKQGNQWVKNENSYETQLPYWTTDKPKKLLEEMISQYESAPAFDGDVINIDVEFGNNRYYRKTIVRISTEKA